MKREKAIVKELDDMGLLVRIEDYSHNVGTHDRCGTTIEPMIKKAVVCKDGRADQARSKSSSGEGNPSDSGTHGKDLLQLDGQHQRLVYFQTAVVGTQNSGLLLRFLRRNRGSAHRADCLSEVRRHNFTQDPDTLDTWFSSALWPFSTLGWPEKTKELEYFYPTDVLVTGYDIIFFWVIRMIFSGYEQMGEKPFKTVLFHGLVRDSQGRKMSKSLGNGIDPLEIIDKYGADALRLTLITGNAPGNDMRFYMERVEANRNFANKVWNASRFILMNMEGKEVPADASAHLEPADKWILSPSE